MPAVGSHCPEPPLGVTGHLPLVPPGQAQPGPALPAVVDGTDWAVLKAGRRKTLLLMESSAKESNAKLVPRALLIFNYY